MVLRPLAADCQYLFPVLGIIINDIFNRIVNRINVIRIKAQSCDSAAFKFMRKPGIF